MRKWSLAISCLVLATSLTTACGYNRTAAPQPGTGTRTQGVTHPSTAGTTGTVGTTAYRATAPHMYNTTAPYANGTTTVPHTYGTGAPHHYGAGTHSSTFDQHLATKAAKAADSVPGVSNAVAVVSGNDALVGVNIRVDANHTRQRHAIEQRVYSAVKAGLPNHHVRITSDTALVARIRALDTGIRQHHGYGGTHTGAGTGTGYGTGYGTGAGTYTGGTGTGSHSIFTGPTTVSQNVRNMGADFGALVRDMGRTVTAPFR
ncbi:YhcN/YlaJ family sporulation lipoprotein [Brevibacillus fluminis]|uniref:YhcN/YlaJ family sporulation lipoprotein n=1 Tax=Brevibacillus fluminis TaxID=511487 RepID=UPI003F8B8A0F